MASRGSNVYYKPETGPLNSILIGSGAHSPPGPFAPRRLSLSGKTPKPALHRTAHVTGDAPPLPGISSAASLAECAEVDHSCAAFSARLPVVEPERLVSANEEHQARRDQHRFNEEDEYALRQAVHDALAEEGSEHHDRPKREADPHVS